MSSDPFRAALCALLVAALAACSTPSADSEIRIAYEKYELPNGLDVVLHVDRSDPVAAVAMTFHVGSSHEVEGRTGFAHMFEHLFFLDSENLGPGGLDRLMTRVGSSTNGSTNRDRTNYFEVVPVDGLEKTLWAEADKLGYFINTVTPDVVAKEKQVVKNEKRQSYDNRPYGHTNYVIDRALYPEGHPYRWQVIGSLQDLDAATLEDVKQFHARWYGPDNATLVVAGDIDVEQTKAWIERYFGEIPSAGTPERAAPAEPVLAGTVRLMHEDRLARLPELTLAWPTVPAYHQDEAALEVLAALLTDGQASPFYKVVVEEKAVAPSVSAFNFGQELAGRFTLRARAFQGVDLDSVLAASEASFARFESEGVDPDQLRRIKASAEADFYRSLSSVLGKAFQLAQYNIFTESPGFAEEQLRRILDVTAEDVVRVYESYVKDRPFVATSFVPAGEGELALTGSETAYVYEEPIVLGAEDPVAVNDRESIATTPSEFDRSVEPPYGDPPSVTPPSVWESSLANGLVVFGIEDREVPVAEFTLRFKGGALAEEIPGTANLLAEVMLEGTAHRTPEELELALDLLGASLGAGASSRNFQISGRTLARNFNETMALLAEVLLEPRWDVDDFERAKARVINGLRAAEGEPTTIAARAFSELVYGEHPLARPTDGTVESTSRITLDDLKAYWENRLGADNAALHVAGAVSASQVEAAAASIAALGSVGIPAVPQPVWDESRAGVYFVDVPGAVQSVVFVGRLGLAENDPQYLPAEFMNFRFGGGGFASELTQVLREGKGYTYGIGSGFSGTDLIGPFSISSRVRANVTLEALQEIKRIMEDYGREFDQADLETTSNYIVKSTARSFETLGAKLGMLSEMSAYGYPPEYVLRRMEVARSMSVDRVRELAEFLNPEEMIWLVVGDAATQEDRLEELGLGRPRRLQR